MKKQVIAAVLSLSVASCAAGGKTILNAHGPVDRTSTSGLAYRFNQSATAAAVRGATSAQSAAMLADGFGLIYASCNDFFEGAGRRQTWLITVRDVVEVVSTIGTGAVALTDGSDDTVAAIAFGSNAIYSSLDVYTRNFLFGAENIDAVRSLILRAVATHRDAILARAPHENDDYHELTEALLDNQTICSPRRIASLTRQAITNGDVVAYTAGEGPEQIAALADQRVLDSLGRLLGLPGAVSADQAGALWWLAIRSAGAEDLATIRSKLGAVPEASSPFDSTGQLRTWALRDRVATELRLFSPTTVQALDAWITAARAAQVEDRSAAATEASSTPSRPSRPTAAPPPQAVTSLAPPLLPQPRGGTGRIELRVD